MNRRTALIATIAAAVAAGAAVWTVTSERRAPSGRASAGGGADALLLPAVSEKADAIASITITRPGQPAVTVVKAADGSWRMRDKADYPAKHDTVRQVIGGLAELREWERKTTLREKYAALGVDDPTAQPPATPPAEGPSQAAMVTLKDSSGAVLADVIVGNRKWGNPGQSGTYVRRAGEPESWLARGEVNVPRDQLAWLDAQFANIDRARVRSVTVTHPGAAPLVVSRDNDKANFAAAGLPEGRELKDPGASESIAAALTGTSFQDVSAAGGAGFDTAAADITPGPLIELRTFDGLIVAVNAFSRAGKQWWKLTASIDESVIQANAAGDAEKAKTDAEILRKEADDLNAQWSAYFFAPVDYKARTLNTTLEDMIKPLTPSTLPPPAPGNAAPASPGP